MDDTSRPPIKWWHRIDLGGGISTPGTADSEAKLGYVGLPERMDGMRVLDVGAWDGWWSFLCERRGAEVVVAVDTWKFDTGRRGFDLAKKALNSKVTPIEMDVHDLHPNGIGTFDLVLCLGVLHHLKSPLLALERLRPVCRGTLVLETHLDHVNLTEGMCEFYGRRSRKPYDDPTCLWGPNPACVEGWLDHAGFRSYRMVGLVPRSFPGGGERGAWHAKA